jgi:hypothetical protein
VADSGLGDVSCLSEMKSAREHAQTLNSRITQVFQCARQHKGSSTCGRVWPFIHTSLCDQYAGGPILMQSTPP